jgi:hypothetical protein
VLAQREGHVVEHGQVGEERAELEQHAHAPAHAEHALAVARLDRLAVEADLAAAGLVAAADQAQQRRLAAAGAAEDGSDLPRAKRSVTSFRIVRLAS